MNKAIYYREIDATDFDEVRAFRMNDEYCFQDSDPRGYREKSREEMDERTRQLMDRLKTGTPRYHCLGAFVSERMVGSIFLEIWDLDGRDACHVHTLWTQPEFRCRGIARELKVRAEVWGRAQDCVFMDTNVMITNAGMIKLNEDLGYSVARYNFRKDLTESERSE